MRQSHALFVVLFGFNTIVFGQQMFNNGGFENYTSCPTGWDQTNKIVGCTGRNDTPEFYNCTYSPGAANNGTGSVYLGSIRNGNSLTQEGINLQLDTPLSAGTEYTISLEVNYHVTVWSDPSFNYNQYRGCFGLRFAFGNGNQFGRPTIYQHEFDSDALVGNANNGYHTYSFTFIPTQNYTHLYIITAAMDGNVSTISNPDCTSAGAIAYVYYHLIDDLSITPNTGLPVELGYFTAVRENDLVQINWNCLTERNNDFFKIEKSVDGLVWESISEVESQGDTQIGNQYKFVDHTALNCITYYRLSQVDFDGKIEVLAVKSINEIGGDKIRFYPNPTSSILNIEGNENLLDNIEVLSLSNGNDVLDVELISNFGTVKTFNVENLKAGIYVIHAGQEYVKFIKN